MIDIKLPKVLVGKIETQCLQIRQYLAFQLVPDIQKNILNLEKEISELKKEIKTLKEGTNNE
ncbi:MAG: hypothetical protein IKB51_07440 [Clostridia bacterium]|nr:hypothetical protein [Clostridia bacterium]